MLTILKHEAIENRKTLTLAILSNWGLAILIGAFFGYNLPEAKQPETWLYAFISLATACIVASVAFSGLKTKEGRISDLMLPASQFSKFAVRWLAVVPALFVVLVIGFYICDLSRILTFRISAPASYVSEASWISSVTNPFYFPMFANLSSSHLAAIVTSFLCGYFFTQSLYLLGAVLWPRLSFIKTLVAIAFVQTVFSILVSVFCHLFNPFNWLATLSGESIIWITNSVITLLTLTAWALAYYRYTRTQVVYKLF